MNIDALALLGLALLASVLALVGGIVFLTVKSWSRFLSRYSVPFAAGVLLTVSLLGLLPEAVHMGGEAIFGTVLLTFLGSYIFEQFFFSLHHHDDERKHTGAHSGSVPLVILGDTIHNTIDGVAVAAAFLVNPGLGLVTAISTFLHEVPHEIGDFGILLKVGFSRMRVFMINLFSSLFTLVGAFGVYYLVRDETLIGHLMAVAAGMFLYLAASDFLPHADEKLSMRAALTSLLIGVGLMWGTLTAIPHSHEFHGEDEYGHEVGELDE